MLDPSRYGEYFADGSSREPEASALSGKPISSGHIHVSVGPHHFVRVNAGEKRALSALDWNAVKADWKSQFADADASAGPDAVVSDLPAFEDMTFADLKQFADDHHIDTAGARSQAQLASKVRAALVMQQFAEPSAPEGGI